MGTGARYRIGLFVCGLTSLAWAGPRFRVAPHAHLVDGKTIALGWSYREKGAPEEPYVEITRNGESERMAAETDGSLHYVRLPYKCGDRGRVTYWIPGMEDPTELPMLPCPGRDDPIRLAFVTDTHADRSGTMANQLARRIASRPVHAVLHGGDLVDTAEDPLEWRSFWQAIAPVVGSRLLLAAAGNHDYGRALPGRHWRREMGSELSGAFYRVKTGAMQIIVLNSNIEQDNGLLDRQLPVLEDWLSDKVTWTVVMFHHPPFTTGKRNKHTGNLKMERSSPILIRERLVPVLRKHGVDLVLNGDSHVFQIIKNDCVHYLVGGASGGWESGETDRYTRHPEALEMHFASTVTFLEVTGSGLTATTESADGRVLSELRLAK